jgi:hypothetical protein
MVMDNRPPPRSRLWRVLALIGFSSTAAGIADAAQPAEEPSVADRSLTETTDRGPAIERVDDIRKRLAGDGKATSGDTSRQYAQWSNWRN